MADEQIPVLAKTVIFMLPDGASASYMANYRDFKEGTEGPVWEPLLKGMVQTDSFNNPVTDSAAGATAYATGVKTRNGSVGVDFSGKELTSVMDLASDAGKATGIVSTAAITDASPAAFGASNLDRDNQADIAQQYIEDNQLDVILGAGRGQFTTEDEGGAQPDGADLIDLAEQQGMAYVASAEDLAAFNGDRVLGLFSNEEYLDPIGERPTEEPTLEQMTEAALDTLSKDEDGFVLFIEEENTDTFGHDNDAATTMHALAAFEGSMKKVLDFQKENSDTLVVMVADHDTGGMTVQPGTETTPAVFRDFTATAAEMAEQIKAADANSIRNTVAEHTRLTLSDEEIRALQGSKDTPLALARLLSEKGGVEFTTTGHTAVNVPIYATGPGAELFTGVQENSAVGQHVAQAMGQSLPADQQDGGAEDLQAADDSSADDGPADDGSGKGAEQRFQELPGRSEPGTSATPVTDDGPADDGSLADSPADEVQANSGGEDLQAAVSLKEDTGKLDLSGKPVDSNDDKGSIEPIVPGAKQSGDDITGNLGGVFDDSVAGTTLHEEPAGSDAEDFLLS